MNNWGILGAMSSNLESNMVFRPRFFFRRPGLAAAIVFALLCFVCFVCLGAARAGPRDAALSLQGLPAGQLGEFSAVFQEEARPLGVDDALARLGEGDFRPLDQAVPKFGIGATPVWLHLAVRNTSKEALPRVVVAGVSWIDRLDIHLLHESGAYTLLAAGDADPSLAHPQPGLGYVLEHRFPPGVTDVLVRAETVDPLVLPLRLLSPAELQHERTLHAYLYGGLYGFLLALIGYNAMLYAGLRERSYLDYALYLGSFVLANVAYTGHGYALLWPDAAGFQRYVILVLMVLFGALGIRFARGFLSLADFAPQLDRRVARFARSGLIAMAAAVLLQWHGVAAVLAFVFVLTVSVILVGLGVTAVNRGVSAGRYFLAAALAAMTGAAVTALAVWRGLPFNSLTLHAAELGAGLEGILLALGLAHRVREHRLAREDAEQLASIDPLTSLLNRRAFLERAAPLWSTALRSDRPLALMMMDIDHFKTINDSFGHATGDAVLAAVGRILVRAHREGDLVARWGGEEFIVLLPETGLDQALALGERLRAELGSARMTGAYPHALSASFGVAERVSATTLAGLISVADEQLYRAKAAGRDQVCSVEPDDGSPAAALGSAKS